LQINRQVISYVCLLTCNVILLMQTVQAKIYKCLGLRDNIANESAQRPLIVVVSVYLAVSQLLRPQGVPPAAQPNRRCIELSPPQRLLIVLRAAFGVNQDMLLT
jgi:hypothetical protein